MAFAGTFAARWTDFIDNLLGKATTVQQRTNIATVYLALVRAEITAAGLNPDALTTAQSAQWALASAQRVMKADYVRLKDMALRAPALATANATVTADVAAAANADFS